MVKIVIDGNIGSGKSTIICKLQDLYPRVFQEEVIDWKDWLPLYYENPEKYSLGFQLKVLLSHIKRRDTLTQEIYIFERSPFSCVYIFGKLLLQDGLLEEKEQKLCEDYYHYSGWIPDLLIYLESSPETCLKRIQVRNRDGEEGISIDYLQKLHTTYQEVLSCDSKVPFPIIRIDANQDIEEVYTQILQEISTWNLRWKLQSVAIPKEEKLEDYLKFK